MEQDGTEDEHGAGAGGAGAEHEVACGPGQDAEEDGLLVAELFKHQRQQYEEDDVGELG